MMWTSARQRNKVWNTNKIRWINSWLEVCQLSIIVHHKDPSLIKPRKRYSNPGWKHNANNCQTCIWKKLKKIPNTLYDTLKIQMKFNMAICVYKACPFSPLWTEIWRQSLRLIQNCKMGLQNKKSVVEHISPLNQQAPLKKKKKGLKKQDKTAAREENVENLSWHAL